MRGPKQRIKGNPKKILKITTEKKAVGGMESGSIIIFHMCQSLCEMKKFMQVKNIILLANLCFWFVLNLS